MSKLVHIEGGPTVRFPDDASEEQISQVLQQDFAPHHDFPSTLVAPTADDNLARAAQTYWEQARFNQSRGLPPPTVEPGEGPDVVLGRAFDFIGKAVRGGLADLGTIATGEDMREDEAARQSLVPPQREVRIINGQPTLVDTRAAQGLEPEPSNIEALVRGQEMPMESERRALPPALQVGEQAATGLVESAPKLAGVVGLEAFGVPAPAAAAAVFGLTPQGFNKQDAAIAAALPYAGRYSGEITGTIARKFGVSTAQALNIFKNAGGVAGAAGYLGLIDESKIEDLPSDQRHAARMDMLAGLIGQSVLGPIGVKPEVPGALEVGGRAMLEQVRGTEFGGVETEAALGGDPRLAAPFASEAEQGQTMPEGTGYQPIEPKPPVQPKPPITRAPGSKFRPEVPGTAAEEREPVLAEIRRKEARTVREIQNLFPKRELSREEARALRNAAWPAAAGATTTGTEETGTPGGMPTTPETRPAAAPSNDYDLFQQLQRDIMAALGKGDQAGAVKLFGELEKIKNRQPRKGYPPVPPAEQPEPVEAGGQNFSAVTPVGNVPVSGHFDVVEADKLLTSSDPGYDQSLQPRDRNRAAASWQVVNIMQHFDPARVGHSLTTDLGAPFIDEAGQVMSGNGRTMALRALYAAGRDRPYRDWLAQNAQDFGLDPEKVSKMARPVLVRRVTDSGGLTKQEFARQSNQQQIAGMSEAEKAGSDARLLSANQNLLSLFRPGEDGNVLAASNREFLNAFIQGTGDEAELTSAKGEYNAPVLARRVRNAILGAYIGSDNQVLLRQLIDGAEELNVKRVVDATLQAAPALMKFKGGPYDLAPSVHQALKDLVSLRVTGEKLEDFLGTKPLFSDPARTRKSDLLLRAIHSGSRSAAKTADGFMRYVKLANEALLDYQSGGMLGLTPATQEQLLERVYGRPESETGAAGGEPKTQANLPLGEPAERPTGPGGESPGTGVRGSGSAGAGPTGGEADAGAGEAKPETQQELRPPGRPPPGRTSAFVPPPAAAKPQARRTAAAEVPHQPHQMTAAAAASQAADAGLRARDQNRTETAAAGPQLQRAVQQSGPLLGVRRMFAPQTIDEGARNMSLIIRAALGKEYEWKRQADFALRTWRKEFDRTPVGRNWQYVQGEALPRNYEVMRAIDTGQLGGLTPSERLFAETMRQQLDRAIDLVQEVSPESLRELFTNYFPRIWRDPEKNQGLLNALSSRRPWEGPKSFLKQRVLEYFTDGLQMGLKPVSDNPVDVTLQKLGEMYRFVATRRAFQEAREMGLRKFFYTFEKKPDAWRKVSDPSSQVLAPPTVTIKEAFDAQMRAKTIELLEQLGVPHERLVKIGGKRWGYAESGSGKIVTKFGGPDSVIWHEFGHQMDWRYPDLRELLPGEGGSTVAKQLRALADLRYEGQTVPDSFKRYVREHEEKLANVFDAYLRAPKKFQEVAPEVWRVFNEWLDAHPEVKNPLNEIQPSLRLGVEETQLNLGGFVQLGDWMMPEGAAQVAENYLTPGLGKYAAFRALRDISGLVNSVQLAGFFHGQFVVNDVLYSGISLPIYDALTGHVARGLGELVRSPIAPFVTLYRGGKIARAIDDPASARADYKLIAKLATEVNLRAGHDVYDSQVVRRWQRAINELLHEPSPGAAWESLYRTPMAVVHTAMKPVMEYLVPRMKLGVFARMAERVIADNPAADPMTLRRLLAQAADATENRLGMVTYDNLFQRRVIKDAAQLALRAYGWHFTKYRMAASGTADWGRFIKAHVTGGKAEVTFDMTYLPAMVIGHAIIGATVMYALTGKGPQQLIDYMFPDTGLVDAYGKKVRVSIADFVKDFIADYKAVRQGKVGMELTRKLSPFLNMAAEMYRKQDFFGTQIFTPREAGEPGASHFVKNLQEGIQYLAGTSQPFSVRGGDKFAQAGGKALRFGPLVGFVPAPGYVTQTAAETRAAEIMHEAGGVRSKEAGERAQKQAQLVRDLRTGKLNREGEFAGRAREAGIRTEADLTRLRQRVTWTPLQYQVHRMALDRAMEVFDLGDAKEKVSLAPFLIEKLQSAWDGGKLEPDKARRFVRLVLPYYKQAKGAARPAPKPQQQERFSAFQPQ